MFNAVIIPEDIQINESLSLPSKIQFRWGDIYAYKRTVMYGHHQRGLQIRFSQIGIHKYQRGMILSEKLGKP